MSARRPIVCALGALLLVSAACTKAEVAPLPPPKQVPATTTTTSIDFTAIGLAAVPGRTTTTIALGPGKAGLSGTVTGPEGPVPGAVVHVERLVGEGMATIDLLASPEGTFAVPKILGGRYRMRAWKPAPDNLALTEPAVFFLEGSEQRTVDLPLTRYQGVAITGAIAPDPPVINTPLSLVIQVVNQEVDARGVVRSTPVPGVSAQLSGSGDWRVQSPNPTTADDGGRARWQLECRRAGAQPLSVVIASATTFTLNLPACAVPPPTPEEVEPTDTTAGGPAPPTSARPPTTSTSVKPTTTTR